MDCTLYDTSFGYLLGDKEKVTMCEASPKMMPGQIPYTAEEWAILQDLFDGACMAEELSDLDELENGTK